jgi:hypothetical protein
MLTSRRSARILTRPPSSPRRPGGGLIRRRGRSTLAGLRLKINLLSIRPHHLKTYNLLRLTKRGLNLELEPVKLQTLTRLGIYPSLGNTPAAKKTRKILMASVRRSSRAMTVAPRQRFLNMLSTNRSLATRIQDPPRRTEKKMMMLMMKVLAAGKTVWKLAILPKLISPATAQKTSSSTTIAASPLQHMTVDMEGLHFLPMMA